MDERKLLTFVSPVYNERDTLAELATRCRQQAGALGYAFRMIFVDDGSTDGSREVLEQLASEHEDICALILRRHFGKSAALAAGFAEVKSGTVVMLDSDLQDVPEELPKLLAALNEGADLVSGWKESRQDGSLRSGMSRVFNNAVSRFAGQELRDCNSGFKACRAEVLRDISLEGDRHRLMMLIAKWKGYRVTEVPVQHEPRRFGQSKYGISRAFSGFLDLTAVLLVERFRHRPLHLFGSIGAILFLLGFVACGWICVERLLHISYVTNRPAFYIGILSMMLGANFFTAGMLAELYNSRLPRSYTDYARRRIGRFDE